MRLERIANDGKRIAPGESVPVPQHSVAMTVVAKAYQSNISSIAINLSHRGLFLFELERYTYQTRQGHTNTDTCALFLIRRKTKRTKSYPAFKLVSILLCSRARASCNNVNRAPHLITLLFCGGGATVRTFPLPLPAA
jgi:hypothetical protein